MSDDLPRDSEPAAEYALVMPFVLCDDHGGPFDAASFTAGWECGGLDYRLSVLAACGVGHVQFVCRAECWPQVDLIIMKHGYTELSSVFCDDEQWLSVTIGGF